MIFSDEHLQDYLAGALSPEDAAQLEAQIEADPTLEARLFAFDYERAAPLRAAFENVPPADGLKKLEALVSSENAGAKSALSRNSWKWPAIAAAAACAAIAVLFAGQTPDTSPSWQNQVAVYQTLYVTDTLSPMVPTQEDLTQQLERSERAIGRPLPLEVVGQLEGLDLLRAQILGFEGAPLIQMAYLSEDGAPVALCAIRLASSAQMDPTFETIAGLPVVHWSDGSFGYMIVGDVDRDVLMKMAETVSNTL